MTKDQSDAIERMKKYGRRLNVSADWVADVYELRQLDDKRQEQIIAAIATELGRVLAVAISPSWLHLSQPPGRVVWSVSVFVCNADDAEAALADSRPVGEPEVVKRARIISEDKLVHPSDMPTLFSRCEWARDIITAYEAGLAARPPVEAQPDV